MTIKPLPGQPSLFEAAPTTADEAQAAAAARRGNNKPVSTPMPEQCRCDWEPVRKSAAFTSTATNGRTAGYTLNG